MEQGHPLRTIFPRVAVIGAFMCFLSCDSKFFGPESRELAGGYSLKRVDDSNQIALIIPYRNGGIIIDEIGWREPIIIARTSGSDYWEAMNTERAQRISISDRDRKSDPNYRSIQTESAETAWAKLRRNKRLW